MGGLGAKCTGEKKEEEEKLIYRGQSEASSKFWSRSQNFKLACQIPDNSFMVHRGN